MITLLTPTGDRPASLKLCIKHILNNAIPADEDVQWIFVDDGDGDETEKLVTGYRDDPFASGILEIEYYRRQRAQGEVYMKSCAANLLFVLPFITGDKILITEDDDYYGSGHISAICEALKDHDLAGTCIVKFYHLPSMSYRGIFAYHASLFTIGFNKKCLPIFKRSLEWGYNFCEVFDKHFWEQSSKNEMLLGKPAMKVLSAEENDVVGIKGVPGRSGCVRGHHKQERPNRFILDLSGDVLRRWVGNASAEAYLNLRRGQCQI